MKIVAAAAVVHCVIALAVGLLMALRSTLSTARTWAGAIAIVLVGAAGYGTVVILRGLGINSDNTTWFADVLIASQLVLFGSLASLGWFVTIRMRRIREATAQHVAATESLKAAIAATPIETDAP